MSKGITKWRTPDGITAHRYHYTVDPEKDTDTPEGLMWLVNASSGYKGGITGLDWLTEMEIKWKPRGPRYVFPDFDRDYAPTVVIEPFAIPSNWPVYVGYDYGYRAQFAACFIAFKNLFESFLVAEIYLTGQTVDDQARLMLEVPYWQQLKYAIGDPSIWYKTQNLGNRMTSIGEMMREKGVYIREGRNEPGVDVAFRDLLIGNLWRNRAKPALKIFSSCTAFTDELKIMKFKDYVSKRRVSEEAPSEKMASSKNHMWDAVKSVMLSRPHAVPARTDVPPDSVEAIKRELLERRKRSRYVI